MNQQKPTVPFWESVYQTPAGSAFGEPSAEILAIAKVLPLNAAVLDLGCGEGRNALFLAECGFDVTAVDISRNGINKLCSLASQRGLKVRSFVADMRTYELDRQFDLIISHGCLHLIERPAWEQLLQRIKAQTTPNGYNVVAVFTDHLAPPPDMEAFCIGLFQEGELFAHYKDWQIELQQCYVFNDEHPGGIRHTHPVNKIVARKANS